MQRAQYAKARYPLTCSPNQFTHIISCLLERWRSRTLCSRWTPARHLWNPLQSTRLWKRQSSTFSRISNRFQSEIQIGAAEERRRRLFVRLMGAREDTHPHPWHNAQGIDSDSVLIYIYIYFQMSELYLKFCESIVFGERKS